MYLWGVWDINVDYRETLAPIFERIRAKKTELEKHRPLPSIAIKKIQETLQIEWTFHSNSIEGNTLSLRETQMVLQEGVTVKGKSLREHFEAKNHETALIHLYKLVESKQPLSASTILDLHGYILRSIEDETAGRLRNSSVTITGANFRPPNAKKASQLFDELIHFINSNELGLNTIELATVFHHKFVWIHPFFDGNGRTVRLAMNLILLQAGFTPAIILQNDRKKYYDALNAANNGNYQKLMLLMAQAIERTLNIYLSAVPDSDDDYKLISELVEEAHLPYGQEYISLLARQGKINAFKQGRNWFTSEEAINEYISAKGQE